MENLIADTQAFIHVLRQYVWLKWNCSNCRDCTENRLHICSTCWSSVVAAIYTTFVASEKHIVINIILTQFIRQWLHFIQLQAVFMINSRRRRMSENFMSNLRHWTVITVGRAWRRYSIRKWKRNGHETQYCPLKLPLSQSASLPKVASSAVNVLCRVASIAANTYSRISVRFSIVPAVWSAAELCAKSQWPVYSKTPQHVSFTWMPLWPSASTYKRFVKKRLSLSTSKTNPTTTIKYSTYYISLPVTYCTHLGHLHNHITLNGLITPYHTIQYNIA